MVVKQIIGISLHKVVMSMKYIRIYKHMEWADILVRRGMD